MHAGGLLKEREKYISKIYSWLTEAPFCKWYFFLTCYCGCRNGIIKEKLSMTSILIVWREPANLDVKNVLSLLHHLNAMESNRTEKIALQYLEQLNYYKMNKEFSWTYSFQHLFLIRIVSYQLWTDWTVNNAVVFVSDFILRHSNLVVSWVPVVSRVRAFPAWLIW